jgi:hypothetical protein
MGSVLFLSPLRGFGCFSAAYPRLAPWAAFWRRFAAGWGWMEYASGRGLSNERREIAHGCRVWEVFFFFRPYGASGVFRQLTFLLPESRLPAASVVSIRAAIEPAFCRAVRVTLVGSMTPAFHQVLELIGLGVVAEVGFLVVADACRQRHAPSSPALATIWRRGSSSALHDVDADLLVAFAA